MNPSSIAACLPCPVEAAWSDMAFNKAMGTSQSFACGGNVMWLDPLFWPQRGVLASQKARSLLQSDFFSAPGLWPMKLPIEETPSAAIVKRQWGNLRQISPPEVLHAFLRAVASDITRGSGFQGFVCTGFHRIGFSHLLL